MSIGRVVIGLADSGINRSLQSSFDHIYIDRVTLPRLYTFGDNSKRYISMVKSAGEISTENYISEHSIHYYRYFPESWRLYFPGLRLSYKLIHGAEQVRDYF